MAWIRNALYGLLSFDAVASARMRPRSAKPKLFSVNRLVVRRVANTSPSEVFASRRLLDGGRLLPCCAPPPHRERSCGRSGAIDHRKKSKAAPQPLATQSCTIAGRGSFPVTGRVTGV